MPFVKGVSGNPSGRKRGETPRGRFTRMVDDALPGVVAKLVEAAKGGDVQAARLILDRVVPPLRAAEEGMALKLPDTPAARGEAVLRALAAGTLSPAQAVTMIQAVEGARMLAERDALERRLEVIEAWLRTSGR